MAENIKTDYGYRINAYGYITPSEAAAWFEDLRRLVGESGRPFGLIADIRSQKANPPESQEIIRQAMVWLRQHGMQRSAVALDSTVARIQLMRIAKAAGAYEYERYLDVSKDPDWERKARAWIIDGIDPDL